jgi:hypothetical protein
MKAVFAVITKKKTAVISLHEPNLSMSKESKTNHVEAQENVGDVF